MVLTAGDLAAAGIDIPLLVGGAALTRRFTHRKIAPAYGGPLHLRAGTPCTASAWSSGCSTRQARPDLEREVAALAANDNADAVAATAEPSEAAAAGDRSRCAGTSRCPRRRTSSGTSRSWIWTRSGRYLNPQMLYGKHLGLKGSVRKLREEGDPEAREAGGGDRGAEGRGAQGGMHARAVWRFFPAAGGRRPADPALPGDRQARGRLGLPAPDPQRRPLPHRLRAARTTTWPSS